MATGDVENGGWTEYQRLVMASLARHEDKLEAIEAYMRTEFSAVKIEIVTLRVKATMWGALAGLVPVLLTLAFAILTGRIK